ncbi:MAG: hypothetical protein R3F62_30040 [Planctomycetota bacterium]
MPKRRDKTRDMARSILPCRNREAARQGKARVARRGRRRAKQALHTGEDGAVELVKRQRRIAARTQAHWRQGGDKVNHFCRWGRARTADVPPEERVHALRAQLGSTGLIAEHALEHFAHAVDRRHLDDRRARHAAARRERTEAWLAQGRPYASEEALRALLVAALEVDHGRLNAALKPFTVRPCDEGAPAPKVPGTTACRSPALDARAPGSSAWPAACGAPARPRRAGGRSTRPLIRVLAELGLVPAPV